MECIDIYISMICIVFKKSLSAYCIIDNGIVYWNKNAMKEKWHLIFKVTLVQYEIRKFIRNNIVLKGKLLY